MSETQDSIQVLEGGGLHPEAVAHLQKASKLARKAARSWFRRDALAQQAIDEQLKARAQLTEAPR